MDPPANPLDDPADAAAMARHAVALADAVDAVVPGWVERSVRARWVAWSGEPLPDGVSAAAAAAGRAARADVGAGLRRLLGRDVEEQATNPLSIIRRAVVHPTRVLRAAGVPEVRRDPDAERLFPDDVYDLSPGSFADVDPSLHELGMAWGAAKAHIVLRRRRPQG